MTPCFGWAMETTQLPGPYTRPSCVKPVAECSTVIPWRSSLSTILPMVSGSCWCAGTM